MSGRLLVAYSNLCTHVTTTREYLEAFARYSSWDVSYVNVIDRAELRFDLNEFDAILHSYCARFCFEDYVSPSYKAALKDFRGVRVLAVQDEYDRTNVLRDAIRELGFHIVLTCVPQHSIEYVYPSTTFPGTDFITVLTGYVPEISSSRHQRRVPLRSRAITIGYRGRDIGPRYGQLGLDKFEIGRRMREICQARGIAHDIEWADEKRIYGEAWYEFVRSCRTMLGSESGSNVFDFDGSIERLYNDLKAERGQVDHENFRSYTDPREREINMGQVSPRVFEAAAQWTPMLLFKGRYSGAIQAGEHYIELEKDFSNVDEVLRQIEDLDALEAMAERAHNHLIKSGAFGYRRFVQKVEAAIASKSHELGQAATLRSASYPRRPQSVTDFGSDLDLVGEYPTPAPKGAVYYFYKHKSLQVKEVSDCLSAEIQRLSTAYGEEIRVRNAEIERLHAVYGEAIQERNSALEQLALDVERLKRKLQRFPKFHSTIRLIPGATALRRALSLLRLAVRNPKKAYRKAAAMVLAPLRAR